MQVHIGQASITDVFRELQEPIMPKTILLARDHLDFLDAVADWVTVHQASTVLSLIGHRGVRWQVQ